LHGVASAFDNAADHPGNARAMPEDIHRQLRIGIRISMIETERQVLLNLAALASVGAGPLVQFNQSGVPVTVYYSKQGDKMVATKVIVKQTVPAVPRG